MLLHRCTIITFQCRRAFFCITTSKTFASLRGSTQPHTFGQGRCESRWCKDDEGKVSALTAVIEYLSENITDETSPERHLVYYLPIFFVVRVLPLSSKICFYFVIQPLGVQPPYLPSDRLGQRAATSLVVGMRKERTTERRILCSSAGQGFWGAFVWWWKFNLIYTLLLFVWFFFPWGFHRVKTGQKHESQR